MTSPSTPQPLTHRLVEAAVEAVDTAVLVNLAKGDVEQPREVAARAAVVAVLPVIAEWLRSERTDNPPACNYDSGWIDAYDQIALALDLHAEVLATQIESGRTT